jgi:hypothetical protein
MSIGNMSKKQSDDNRKQNPYFVDKFASVSPKLKIGFLKFWIAGMTFYVAVLGLPERFDFLDRMVMWGLLFVLGTEYITIPIISWMHNDSRNTIKYLPHEVKRKSILSLLASFLYVGVMVALTNLIIALWIKIELPTIGDLISEASIDPFSFALLYLLLDSFWWRIRNLIKNMVKRKDANDA